MTREDFTELRDFVRAAEQGGCVMPGVADSLCQRLWEIRCEDCALEEAASQARLALRLLPASPLTTLGPEAVEECAERAAQLSRAFEQIGRAHV